MRYFFLKENSIFSIKLGQRLPKSIFQLHVKNSRFFLSCFMKKKNDWPKAAEPPLYRASFFELKKKKNNLYQFSSVAYKNVINHKLKRNG